MKKNITSVLIAAGLVAGAFCNTASAAYTLNFTGTMSYNNGTTTSGGFITAKPTTVAGTSQSLIKALNNSPEATNVIFGVTGKLQIPAGSYIIVDPTYNLAGWNGGALAITNANGFFFPLEGPGESYEFGDLYLADSSDGHVVGTSKQSESSLAGTESDVTDFYFWFDTTPSSSPSYEVYFEIYGAANLTATATARFYGPLSPIIESGIAPKVASYGWEQLVVVAITGNAAGYGYINGFDSEANGTISISGGSFVATGDYWSFPFALNYYRWY
jgi:hypothetical protein